MRKILERVAGHAISCPDGVALVDADTQISYADLIDRVQRIAVWAATLPRNVALLAPKSTQWVIWYLALVWSGRRIVPLPEFFSQSQLAHIIQDADIQVVVCPPEFARLVADSGVPTMEPEMPDGALLCAGNDASLVIYTSGTSGHPKGVVLEARQLAASIDAMAQTVAATAEDRMLSVLPHALLLEQIAGIFVPLSAGGRIIVCGQMAALPMAAETFAPTATVLVPELLAAWVSWLEHTGRTAPPSLRFGAVGGAPVSPGVAEKAWALGLPVHEGYGLSECCSVVAVNAPGERRAGTVGRPLPNLNVTIENGEIVVAGPTVMAGYLGADPIEGRHFTGDAGQFDEDGYLIVHGRIDDVIVTSTGRNIHPEWIEGYLLSDPRISRCAVIGGGTHPHAVVVPAGDGLEQLSTPDLLALSSALCAEVPAYAHPKRVTVLSDSYLHQHGLITTNGRLRRRAIANHLAESL